MKDLTCSGAIPTEAESKPGRYGSPWFWAACALIVLGFADRMMSDTVLITPIDPTLLWGFRAIGGLIGLAMLMELLVMPFATDKRLNRVILFFVVPFGVGAAFDCFAWQLVNHVRFARSAAAFETAVYPVLGVHHSNKGNSNSVTIDPFSTGEVTHLSISYAQYKNLHGKQGLCVTVAQRREPGGAVQVALKPPTDSGATEFSVRDCVSANAWR
jgi:hypothetical protein